MSVLYTSIARFHDREVLVECTECEGNVQSVAREIIKEIGNKGFSTIEANNKYMYAFMVDDHMIYFCMCFKQDHPQVSAFLGKVRKEFEARFSYDDEPSKVSKFQAKLKTLMREYNSKDNKLDAVDMELAKLESEVIETNSRI